MTLPPHITLKDFVEIDVLPKSRWAKQIIWNEKAFDIVHVKSEDGGWNIRGYVATISLQNKVLHRTHHITKSEALEMLKNPTYIIE